MRRCEALRSRAASDIKLPMDHATDDHYCRAAVVYLLQHDAINIIVAFALEKATIKAEIIQDRSLLC